MRQIFVSFYKSTLYIKVRQHTALMLCDSRRNKTNHVSSVKASEEEIQLSLKALNVYKPSENALPLAGSQAKSSYAELNWTFFWIVEVTSTTVLTPSRQVGNPPVPEPATAPIPTPVRTNAVAPKAETQDSQVVAISETKVDTEKSKAVVATDTPGVPKEDAQAKLQVAKATELDQADQEDPGDSADKDNTTRKAWDVEPCHTTPCCC